MKNFLVIALLVSLSSALFAEEGGYEPVFTISFEDEEGYVLGGISDQQGWCCLNDKGTNEVVDVDSYEGSNSLHLFGTEFKLHKDFDLTGYENLPTLFSFAIRPGTDFTRATIYGSSVNDAIATLHIKCAEIASDTSGYASRSGLDFDTLEWYEVELCLDPASKTLSYFRVGDVTLNYNENQDKYKNYETAESGAIGGVLLYNNWNDVTDSNVDYIRISVVPEPACLAAAALLFLCLTRKIYQL
ncbi:hypothetical protein J6X96_06315 [bacterium]|nr:hypothetical protein [bacterium]